jgi:MYXO-CTERM domain-containing protein
VEGVETWIGSLLEIDGNGAAKESRFAVQFFEVNGWPIVSSSPVPEPSTYAWWAVGICAIVMWRRRARQ